MKTIALALLAVLALAPAESYDGPTGIQLYSLRDYFKANGPEAGLAKTQELGFELVELAGTYGKSPADFLKMLADKKLKAVSGHFGYDRWAKEPEVVAAEAKALGLEHAGCAWANHKAPLDEKQTRDIIAVFTKAGEACAKQGVRFFYHFHGFEFGKHGDETLADLIIKETKPDQVSFQLDVLWVVFPGHDPAKLLEKYPGRWVSMHLKDLKKGVETGSLAGKTDVRNNVVLGTGQSDWPAILKAAKKAGVKYYFIEDESPDAIHQIPQSLSYLKTVKF